MKKWMYLPLMVAVIFAVGMIPDGTDTIVQSGTTTPFLWNKDAYFEALETEFSKQRQQPCDGIRNAAAGATPTHPLRFCYGHNVR